MNAPCIAGVVWRPVGAITKRLGITAAFTETNLSWRRDDDQPFREITLYRCGISKCFLPKRRASIDHAPGPIIARLAPKAARSNGASPPERVENAIHSSTTAIEVPLTGVHRPKNSNMPQPAAIQWGILDRSWDDSRGYRHREQQRKAAVAVLSKRRPLPGQLFGNVEKSRCKSTPFPTRA